MIAHELIARCGTAALLRVVGSMLLVTVLHLARIPLLVVLRVLEGVMARVDGYATRTAAAAPRRPLNNFAPASSTASASVRAPVMGGASR